MQQDASLLGINLRLSRFAGKFAAGFRAYQLLLTAFRFGRELTIIIISPMADRRRRRVMMMA